MYTAMHIGVIVCVITIDCIDYGARLLRGGGVIEIDQWPAVHFLIEQRKIAAQNFDIEGIWDDG
jgi:hypothetical protein